MIKKHIGVRKTDWVWTQLPTEMTIFTPTQVIVPSVQFVNFIMTGEWNMGKIPGRSVGLDLYVKWSMGRSLILEQEWKTD